MSEYEDATPHAYAPEVTKSLRATLVLLQRATDELLNSFPAVNYNEAYNVALTQLYGVYRNDGDCRACFIRLVGLCKAKILCVRNISVMTCPSVGVKDIVVESDVEEDEEPAPKPDSRKRRRPKVVSTGDAREDRRRARKRRRG